MGLLKHALLQHAAHDPLVVVHDEYDRSADALRRFDLHAVEAKGAIAVDTDHRHIRAGQLGADRERHADTHAAV